MADTLPVSSLSASAVIVNIPAAAVTASANVTLPSAVNVMASAPAIVAPETVTKSVPAVAVNIPPASRSGADPLSAKLIPVAATNVIAPVDVIVLSMSKSAVVDSMFTVAPDTAPSMFTCNAPVMLTASVALIVSNVKIPAPFTSTSEPAVKVSPVVVITPLLVNVKSPPVAVTPAPVMIEVSAMIVTSSAACTNAVLANVVPAFIVISSLVAVTASTSMLAPALNNTLLLPETEPAVVSIAFSAMMLTSSASAVTSSVVTSYP